MTGAGDEGPAPDVVWTAGQVARHLGIAESTLRSWHRRYRIGPNNTPARSYRRYAPDDVRRLRRMRDLVRSGMLPSDAARDVNGAGHVNSTGHVGGEQSRADRSPAEDAAALLVAARLLDTQRCRALLGQSLNQRGVRRTWDEVCRPALGSVTVADDRFDESACIAGEHVLSWAISSALQRVDRPDTTPDVLLACTEAEYHTLPLEALAAALGELGTAVRMIGAATPAATLAHAVTTARPTAVVLWSQQSQTASAEALTCLLAAGVTHRIIAGPGWPTPAPEGVRLCASLIEALALLTS
jgi:MerR family transcriptional regulator, light-induced transcriptional regulator